MFPAQYGLDAADREMIPQAKNNLDKMILSIHTECASSRYNTLVAVGRIELPTYGL